MKISKKILTATLLISAISYIPSNIIGVEQREQQHQSQKQQVQNIRDEILKYNFTHIDPNVFVMTIARAKTGSLANVFNKNQQFTIGNSLLDQFHKAIIDLPKIDSVTCNASKSDINTLNDQINNIHSSIGYDCIKDTVNVIDSRESGELGIIVDLGIALKLFKDSFIELINNKNYQSNPVANAIGKLEEHCRQKSNNEEIEYKNKMLAKQAVELPKLQKTLDNLSEKVTTTSEMRDCFTKVLKYMQSIQGELNTKESTISDDTEKGWLENLEKIETLCETYRTGLQSTVDQEYYQKHLKDHAIIERISATMLHYPKSLLQIKNASLMPYLI